MCGVPPEKNVSLKRDAVCPTGSEQWGTLLTFALSTLLHGPCHHSYAWCSDPWKTPGIRSPSSDLWTSRLTRFGLTPLWLRMQWLWTEGAMLVQMCPVKYGKVFLQHARLLASFPIGVYSDRAPESAWTDSGKHISCSYTAFEALLNHIMARKWSFLSFMCRKKTHQIDIATWQEL